MTTKGGKHELWREARIEIGGTPLTFAQSMTVRVALESFVMQLRADGLGDDAHGKAMTHGYLARLREVRKLMMDALGDEFTSMEES